MTFNTEAPLITWPDLIKGTLIKRYKRSLADVRLKSGETITVHCPNSGSMQTCAEPDRQVYLSTSTNPKRKYKHTWIMIDMGTSLVGIDTLVPNRLLKSAAEHKMIPELAGYHNVTSEVTVSDHSRLDLMLTNGKQDRCYIEIKNCTLVQDRIASFPDAVTARGLKHLKELQNLVAQGFRCVSFYLIQRMDAERFQPAGHIDPAYGEEL
ncbi:MAG: DNA/RNA nuclease SfsA, partial [bacterium]|nr:DNA/RNA nuclease SfsA [bacterium]